MTVTKQNIDYLLKGASLLACGGGLSYEAQLEDIKKVLPQLPIPLIKWGELKDTDAVITVSEIGPSDVPPISKQSLPKLIDVLVNKYKLSAPKAILPFEIGQESITLESATVLGLPVVDSDMSGQRAVPKIGLDLINLNGKRSSGPVIAINDKEEILTIDSQLDAIATENKLRDFARESNGVVLVISDYQLVASVKQLLIHSAYSYAINLGEHGIGYCPKRVQYEQEITIKAIKLHENPGFYSATVNAIDETGNTLQLEILNEFIALDSDDISFAFPDLIMVEHNNTGVAGFQLKTEQSYKLVVLNALDEWINLKPLKDLL